MAKNKFQALNAALKGDLLPEQVEETPQVVEPLQPTAAIAPPTRQGRQKGKRSNPDYIQVGAYIPKILDKDVKRLLIDEDQDFSDLITALLTNWVSSKSVK